MKKMIRLCVLALAIVLVGNLAIGEFYVVPVANQGISGYEVIAVWSASNSDSLKDLTAECPAGKRPLGGGVKVAGSVNGVGIFQNCPTWPDPTGWQGHAQEIVPTSNNWQLGVFAICADVP